MMMRSERVPPGEPPFTLTKEEQLILNNCTQSSIFSVEVPAVISAGLLTKLGMNYGYIKNKGSRIVTACLGTFVLARFYSYHICFKRLVQMPGSTVIERINQRMKVITKRTDDQGPQNVPSPELYSAQYQQPSYLDMDNDRPDLPGIDSSLPDASVDEQLPSKPSQSYADLRRQNRESYQQVTRGTRPPSLPEGPSIQPSRSPQGPPPLPTYEAPAYEPASSATPRRTRVNKYGDVWEE